MLFVLKQLHKSLEMLGVVSGFRTEDENVIPARSCKCQLFCNQLVHGVLEYDRGIGRKGRTLISLWPSSSVHAILAERPSKHLIHPGQGNVLDGQLI